MTRYLSQVCEAKYLIFINVFDSKESIETFSDTMATKLKGNIISNIKCILGVLKLTLWGQHHGMLQKVFTYSTGIPLGH